MHLHRLMFYLPSVSFVRNQGKIVGAGVSLVNSELDSAENAIKDTGNNLNDRDMLTKFGIIDFHTIVVKCHEICRSKYLNRTGKQ